MFKFVMILIVVAFGIALWYSLYKKRKEKLEEEKRLENERREQAEKDLIERIKSNVTIQGWACAMAQFIRGAIQNSPWKDWEFHLIAYTYGVDFGLNLQKIYFPYIKKYSDADGRNLVARWIFSKYALPDLESEQMNLFEDVLTDMIVSWLLEREIKVKKSRCPRVMVYETVCAPDFLNDCFIHTINYEKKKVEGSW